MPSEDVVTVYLTGNLNQMDERTPKEVIRQTLNAIFQKHKVCERDTTLLKLANDQESQIAAKQVHPAPRMLDAVVPKLSKETAML